MSNDNKQSGLPAVRWSDWLVSMKKHIWIQHTSAAYANFETCKVCGTVKRRDGKNAPCNGPAKLRKLETIGANDQAEPRDK